jgi:hypothetical protein
MPIKTTRTDLEKYFHVASPFFGYCTMSIDWGKGGKAGVEEREDRNFMRIHKSQFI